MLDQHCARDGKHQREPVTKFHEDIKIQRPHRPTAAAKPPPVATKPASARLRKAVNAPRKIINAISAGSDAQRMELAGDDGVGDVPNFADQQRVFFQRRCAKVRQVIPCAADPKRQLAAKVIAKFIGSVKQPLSVLPEQIFNRRAPETRIIWFEPPINVKIAIAVHGNHTFNTLRAAQCDAAVRQIQIGVGEVEV